MRDLPMQQNLMSKKISLIPKARIIVGCDVFESVLELSCLIPVEPKHERQKCFQLTSQ